VLNIKFKAPMVASSLCQVQQVTSHQFMYASLFLPFITLMVVSFFYFFWHDILVMVYFLVLIHGWESWKCLCKLIMSYLWNLEWGLLIKKTLFCELEWKFMVGLSKPIYVSNSPLVSHGYLNMNLKLPIYNLL
jgi:hypothetical protein